MRGGLLYIEGGGVTLVKHWTSLYLFLQLRETNSVPAFLVRDRGLNAWYGHGGVLDFRKQQTVRADQAVEAKAGLLNLQRGVPRGWGADWGVFLWCRTFRKNSAEVLLLNSAWRVNTSNPSGRTFGMPLGMLKQIFLLSYCFCLIK